MSEKKIKIGECLVKLQARTWLSLSSVLAKPTKRYGALEPRDVWRRAYRVGQKRGHKLMTIILSIPNRFKNFFAGRFPGKFAVKWISKVPSHLAYVATLPCETLMSAKQAINDKLQSSVVTYLRCGWVVNNQIKKGLLLSLWVKIFLNRWIFGKITRKNVDSFVHFLRLLAVWWPGAKSAWDNHAIACNFAKYSPI